MPSPRPKRFWFCKKYNLEISPVVKPEKDNNFTLDKEAYTGPGYLFNSEFLNDLKVPEESIQKHWIFREK